MSGPSSPDLPSHENQEQSVATTSDVVATGVDGKGVSSNTAASAAIQEHRLQYLYASNVNVGNFVSVKLSSEGNYHLWKSQMLCLLKSQNMAGLVDKTFPSPSALSEELKSQYESLLRGWIFGSVSENVLGAVVDLPSAKDVWAKLQSFYGATKSLQQAALTPEPQTTVDDARDIEANHNDTETKTKCLKNNKLQNLRKATLKGDWNKAGKIIHDCTELVIEEISDDGSTILHMAVGIGHNNFVKNLLFYIKDNELLEGRRSDGSTALHIAAIVGNTYAADLLVAKNNDLLKTEDHDRKRPLERAYECMHLDTILYLFKISDDGGKTTVHRDVHIGVDLLVNAISAKRYSLASELIEKFPNLAVENDGVLMALAKTFPSGLNYAQKLIYPSFDRIFKATEFAGEAFFKIAGIYFASVVAYIFSVVSLETPAMRDFICICLLPIMIIPLGVTELIFFLISIVIILLYSFLWEVASVIVPPIKHIETKKSEWEAAEKVLLLVCDNIDKFKYPGTHHPFYTGPILEAARQNAHKVVDEILFRSPKAIQCKDKNGYDIIQLAVLHRSHKIYNLIFDIGERKNLYRTIQDSSKNNILHLAGKLAPSHELSHITGAAFQLQRELQWSEEVKKLVFPTYITQENIFKETPSMVFTREHANLLKEGEQWIKTTAESSSITAALITTIVFAAAITVPGGNNQETGTPLFRKDIAFTIFALSDAISLFASSTALLVFLSILTARFAEKDFLVRLPRRLLFGICALLLSTIAMMVAFSATLFIVFGDQKPWMLGPICGLASIPISFFVTVQFPLIVDLAWSTYIPIFGKKRKSASRRFNPDTIRLLFGLDRSRKEMAGKVEHLPKSDEHAPKNVDGDELPDESTQLLPSQKNNDRTLGENEAESSGDSPSKPKIRSGYFGSDEMKEGWGAGIAFVTTSANWLRERFLALIKVSQPENIRLNNKELNGEIETTPQRRSTGTEHSVTIEHTGAQSNNTQPLLLEVYTQAGVYEMGSLKEKKSAMSITHRLCKEELNAKFWDLLSGSEDSGWLDSTHMSLWARLLRERSPKDAKWMIMPDEYFQFFPKSDWVTYLLEGDDMGPVKPWWEVKRVYFPINIKGTHWVLGELLLDSMTFNVYDSLHSRDSFEEMSSSNGHFEKFQASLQTTMDSIGYWGEVGLEPQLIKVNFNLVKEMPQQSGGYGDCGVFVCMFLERLVSDYDLSISTTTDVLASEFRSRMASIYYGSSKGKVHLEDLVRTP